MRKKKAETDIILPNYNSYKYLDATIKSVISQTYKNWRLIIVDDASNQKTKKIVKKYQKIKKIKIIWLNKNRGAAFCRNLGLKISKSKYIAFLDSDDIWDKKKLSQQIAFIKNNNYNFTYTYYEAFGRVNNKIRVPDIFSYSSFIKDTSISMSTILLNRKIVKNIKFIDTKVCEDYLFKCDLLRREKYAYCLKKYLAKYRVRDKSLQSNKLRNVYCIWKINKKYNKLNFFENINSILSISLSSLKKYGFK